MYTANKVFSVCTYIIFRIHSWANSSIEKIIDKIKLLLPQILKILTIFSNDRFVNKI